MTEREAIIAERMSLMPEFFEEDWPQIAAQFKHLYPISREQYAEYSVEKLKEFMKFLKDEISTDQDRTNLEIDIVQDVLDNRRDR